MTDDTADAGDGTGEGLDDAGDGTGEGLDDDTGDAGDASDARTGRSTPTVTIGDEGFQPDEGNDGTGGGDTAAARTTAGLENAVPDPDEEFDWRGWLLVGVVVVAFLVAPGLIYLRPVWLGGFRATYLLLPLVPAFLMGAAAVWVAVSSRQG